jgi:hypothetical protein
VVFDDPEPLPFEDPFEDPFDDFDPLDFDPLDEAARSSQHGRPHGTQSVVR